MLGFNGGLIGKARDTSLSASVPGVWTPLEQIKAERAIAWPPNLGEDPYFANVSLLLRGDGANGSTTFTDSSLNGFAMTAVGNAQISTTQSKYGGASMYFDGAGDYVESPSNSAFSYGTGDFTVEMWIYPPSGAANIRTFYNNLLSAPANTGFLCWMQPAAAGFYSIDVLQSSAAYVINSSLNDIAAAQWSHFAACRSGTTLRLFVNGVQVSSGTMTTNVTATQMRLASPLGNSSGSDWSGYIDDLRITKGVARYTSNFTPPGAL
jgi:hypothetical protein